MIDIDGNTYNIVKIGEQYWMAENLKTTKYNDGSPIPFIDNESAWSTADENKTPAYCYYNDDANNKQKYGALYNWYVVNTGKLAPEGWRVPTNADWAKLDCVVESLTAKTDWVLADDDITIGNNESGFTALPGGFRNLTGDCFGIRLCGNFWSATDFNAYANYRYINYKLERLFCHSCNKGYGYSVRLIKEEL